jgi:hypothetical protein
MANLSAVARAPGARAKQRSVPRHANCPVRHALAPPPVRRPRARSSPDVATHTSHRLFHPLQRLNEAAKRAVQGVQGYFVLAWNAVRFIFARPFYGGDVVQQMDSIGVQSLGIVLLTGFFTGMVLALQFSVQMAC